MDSLWIPHGFPMGPPCEFHMDSLWIPYGFPMDLPMDSIWIPHEFPMDLLDHVNIDPYINPCIESRIPI